MSNTTPQRVDLEITQMLAKNKQFLFLTKHQPCYWSSPGKVVSMLKERKHPHTSEMPFDKLIFRKGHPPCDDDLRICVAKILSQEHRSFVSVSFSSAAELCQ